MSLTLSLTGSSSVLTAEYFPPLELSGDYVCGLIDFQTYNSIPNIDESNNLMHVGDALIEIPVGSYEIDNIATFVQESLNKSMSNNINNNRATIVIRANNNTLKSEIKATEAVHFDRERSIAPLLGFGKRVLEPNVLHTSELPVNIIKVNAIRVECSIISGSFINNNHVHTLHEFSPNVGPGYKIVEVPTNVIYLPVSVKLISSLTLKLVDQDGDLINFRGETITIRLHLKPQNADLR